MNGWLEARLGLLWLQPAWMWCVFLLPLALWWRQRRGEPSVTFAPLGVVSPSGRPLPISLRARLRAVPRTMIVVGLLLVIVALARPVVRAPVPEVHEGIDIVLCLDVSSSMEAEDLDATQDGRTRLTVARDAAARFIAGREHDRIGLVLFARYPDLRCPPTTDHDALQQILAASTTVDSDSQEDATGIGTAIARAAQVLAESATPSKVVILLTDGDENVATERAEGEIAPVHAGQLCRQLGVRVYTISAVPTSQPASAPQASQVRRLSELTGGRFFAARDAASVDGVYAAIADLERARRPAPRFVFLERFTVFALAGTLLIILGRLLGLTVWRTLP